jgi:uncharacterized protein (TIGR02597 family)
MKSLLSPVVTLLTALSLTLLPLSAHSATSDPVGAMTVTINEGADNFIAIPFTSAPSYQGAVASIANASGDIYDVGLGSSLPSAASDGLAGFYYVRFLSGAAEGKYFTILNSGLTSLSIDSLGDDLSGVQVGDSFAVYEYYTLSSLFPPATQTSIVVSTSTRGSGRGSEVLFPEMTDVGINRAPRLKYFVTSSNWHNAADPTQLANDVIVYPDSYIIVRQKAGAGARDLVLFGAVPMKKSASYVFQTTSKTDNHLAYTRPVATTLSNLGFGSEFGDSGSTRGSSRVDELLLWENPVGLNPSPNKKFFRVGGVWYDSFNNTVADSYVVNPGTALIFRKVSSSIASTYTWVNVPNY